MRNQHIRILVAYRAIITRAGATRVALVLQHQWIKHIGSSAGLNEWMKLGKLQH